MRNTIYTFLLVTPLVFSAERPSAVKVEFETNSNNDTEAVSIELMHKSGEKEDALLGDTKLAYGVGKVFGDDDTMNFEIQGDLSQNKNGPRAYYIKAKSDVGPDQKNLEASFELREDKNSYGEYASKYYVDVGYQVDRGKEGSYTINNSDGTQTDMNGRNLLTSCYIGVGAEEGMRLNQSVAFVVGYSFNYHGCAKYRGDKNNQSVDGNSGFSSEFTLGANIDFDAIDVEVKGTYTSRDFGKTQEIDTNSIHNNDGFGINTSVSYEL